MSSINDIITQFKEDLEDKFKTTLGYNTDPIVRYGVYWPTETETSPPTICYTDTNIAVEEVFGEAGHGWLKLLIYGWTENDGLGDTTNIHNLSLDMLYFLFNDFTYISDLGSIGDLEIFPGDENIQISFFRLEVEVKFDFTNTNINN